MKFQPGNNMNPGGRPKVKMMTDALRYFAGRPVTPKGNLGRPKKMTAAQAIAWRMLTRAMEGDMIAANIVFNRLDGTVSNDIGGAWDIPAPQSREITLKEAARRVAFLLLSNQPDNAPTTIEN